MHNESVSNNSEYLSFLLNLCLCIIAHACVHVNLKEKKSNYEKYSFLIHIQLSMKGTQF